MKTFKKTIVTKDGTRYTYTNPKGFIAFCKAYSNNILYIY